MSQGQIVWFSEVAYDIHPLNRISKKTGKPMENPAKYELPNRLRAHASPATLSRWIGPVASLASMREIASEYECVDYSWIDEWTAKDPNQVIDRVKKGIRYMMANVAQSLKTSIMAIAKRLETVEMGSADIGDRFERSMAKAKQYLDDAFTCAAKFSLTADFKDLAGSTALQIEAMIEEGRIRLEGRRMDIKASGGWGTTVGGLSVPEDSEATNRESVEA